MPASRCGCICRRPGWRGSASVRSYASTGRAAVDLQDQVAVGGRDGERIAQRLAALRHAQAGCRSRGSTSATPASACAESSQNTRQPCSPPDAPAPVIEQPGRCVGDAGDEVRGVELGGVDEHGDGGVGDVAAQRFADALAQARARDARLSTDTGDEQRRRQRRRAAEHLHGDRVRVFHLLGAGEHAGGRAADHGGAGDGAAHGAEHAGVFVVVVLDAGEDDGDLGRAHAGGGERAVRGQACGCESVQVDGDSDSGRVHRLLLPR